MSLDSVDDIEAAEDLLAELGAILAEVMAPITDGPLKPEHDLIPQQALDVFESARVMILGMEPFPSLQRIHDRIEAWCRPTCGAQGEPHDRDDADAGGNVLATSCGCPCHDRPPQAVIDAALDAFRQPPDA